MRLQPAPAAFSSTFTPQSEIALPYSVQTMAKKEFNWGMHFYQQGNYEKALRKFELALCGYVQSRNQLGMGRSLNGMSAVYLHLEKYERSLAYSHAAEAILESTASQADYALALYQQGISHFRLGHTAAAEICCEQALAQYAELDDMGSENRVLLHLGQVYGQQGKNWFALACFEAVLTSVLDIPDQDPTSEILSAVLRCMMQLCAQTKGEEDAIATYQTLLQRHLSLDNQEQVAYSLRRLGQYHEAQEHYRLALECYAQALQTLSPLELV
jgi:tetratricopeptide (TPR) repeat protein